MQSDGTEVTKDFQSSAIYSLLQLALALLLRDHLPCLAGPPEAFDPAFTEVDAALLSQLGVTPMSVNEGGARSVSEPTLFYLPHCEVRVA